ncbi:MAG: PP2C family protein-serine/threonine phosphatase [Chlamydiales bacterium]|nr:PP2C family protein-serine/threonine phosphatase [Chlamydiales bacterium]
MIPFRKSIGFRLLGISFILLALPLLVDSFILIQTRYRHAVTDAKDHLVEIAQLRAVPLAEIQPANKPLLELLSYFLKLQTDFPQEPNKELNERLGRIAKIGGLTEIHLLKITEDKRYIATATNIPRFLGSDFTDFLRLEDLYSPSALKRSFSIYITYDTETFEPFFIVATLIFSPKEKRPIGVLAVTSRITDKLKELLRKDDRIYPVNFALLLPSSIVFAASDPDFRFQYFQPLDPEYRKLFLEQEPIADKLLPDEPMKTDDRIGDPFFEFEWKGRKQIGYIKKPPDADFGLLVYASKDEIFRAPVMTFFHVYGTYALILLIGGTVAYFLTRRMAKPIQKLSLVMAEIQKGNLQLRYKKDPLGFEINVLGKIFNEMVDAVLEQKKVAQEERVVREIYARELRLGREVQRSLLLQKMPDYPGADVAATYIPAIEVGGDFYDVFVRGGEKESSLVLAIADASGKGVQACFYSLSLRNMLRTYAMEYDDAGMAMSAANNLFTPDTAETGMFVTVLMGIYDYRTGMFSYFSSGHNPGIVRRKDGSIEMLSHHGVSMGVILSKEQEAESIRLNSGDAVIFYTDGITEAHNERFELYGEERLANLIKAEGWRSSSDIVERIVADVNTFSDKAPQHDDITLLVMKTK